PSPVARQWRSTLPERVLDLCSQPTERRSRSVGGEEEMVMAVSRDSPMKRSREMEHVLQYRLHITAPTRRHRWSYRQRRCARGSLVEYSISDWNAVGRCDHGCGHRGRDPPN